MHLHRCCGEQPHCSEQVSRQQVIEQALEPAGPIARQVGKPLASSVMRFVDNQQVKRSGLQNLLLLLRPPREVTRDNEQGLGGVWILTVRQGPNITWIGAIEPATVQ